MTFEAWLDDRFADLFKDTLYPLQRSVAHTLAILETASSDLVPLKEVLASMDPSVAAYPYLLNLSLSVPSDISGSTSESFANSIERLQRAWSANLHALSHADLADANVTVVIQKIQLWLSELKAVQRRMMSSLEANDPVLKFVEKTKAEILKPLCELQTSLSVLRSQEESLISDLTTLIPNEATHDDSKHADLAESVFLLIRNIWFLVEINSNEVATQSTTNRTALSNESWNTETDTPSNDNREILKTAIYKNSFPFKSFTSQSKTAENVILAYLKFQPELLNKGHASLQQSYADNMKIILSILNEKPVHQFEEEELRSIVQSLAVVGSPAADSWIRDNQKYLNQCEIFFEQYNNSLQTINVKLQQYFLISAAPHQHIMNYFRLRK